MSNRAAGNGSRANGTPDPISALGPIGTLRSLISTIASRYSLASRAGITFGGKRDLYAALGYAREIQLSDYRERYRRNAVAGRVVDSLPSATWRGGAELIEDEDPNVSTKFERAWEDLEKRLNVWSVFSRADRLAGLGRYGVVLIGAPGDMAQELPSLKKPEDLLYLSPFGEDDATIDQFELDPASARFGLPTAYRFRRINPGPTQMPRLVHWSRVLHIADGVLDEQVFGIPRLERIWNLLDDLEKVTGGGAEAFWLRAHQGYQFNLDKDVELDTDDELALTAEVDEFMHGMRRAVRTRGMEMKTLGSDVANFGNPADAIMSQISAGTGIPQRILMGSERGELASSQDASNWDDRVSDRRKEFAGPFVVRTFVDRLIEHGGLPEPKEYEVRWPKIQNLDDAGRAQVAATWAGLNAAAGETVVTPDEIRDRVLDLPPLETLEDEVPQPKPGIPQSKQPGEALDLSPKGGAPSSPKPAPNPKASSPTKGAKPVDSKDDAQRQQTEKVSSAPQRKAPAPNRK